jgi:hypothetical protein
MAKEPPHLGIFGALSALVLCCAIVAILAYTSGREGVRRSHVPASYSEAAKADAQRACLGRESQDAFECIYEKVDASQEQARGEQDLTAQQRAASSALANAFVAFLTLILTGLGVWYVKRTLEATLKAVEDTSLATQAMQRQNKIAEAAQRPWLTVIVNNLGPVERRHDGTFHCPYNVTVKNTGLSPALTVGFTIGTEKATIDRQICFSSFVEEAYRLISQTSSSIAPNSDENLVGIMAVDMGNIDQNGCRPNKTLPLFWVGVAYQDGISSVIYYTTLICAPGAIIRPGEGTELFILRPVKMKTIMGIKV